MSVWSKRITEAAAFWGMLAGVLFNVVPKALEFIGLFVLPSYLNPALLGAIASLAVTLLVSRSTSVTAQESAFLRQLHETPVEEVSRQRTRVTLLAPIALLVVNGLVMPYLLIRFYVRPYQTATGTLLPDGSLDWFTGEVYAAASWVMIYLILGLVASYVVRKDYAR